MDRRIKNKLFIVFFCLLPCVTFARSLPARAQIIGMVGSTYLGKFEYLQSLSDYDDKAYFFDLQGKAAGDEAEFAGLGGGFRVVNNQRILGGYLFVDDNFSPHHNSFWVINPGFESLGETVDLRVNAYIPINDRSQLYDTTGTTLTCENSFFTGHQQFVIPINYFEQVGPGGDLALSFKAPNLNQLSFKAGVYYYQQNDLSAIKGVASKIELPINPIATIRTEASYDNQQQFAIMAGLTLNFGTSQPNNRINSHLYDPIERQIGTVKTGSGIPIVTRQQAGEPITIRDNIFFFTAQGGDTFENNSVSGTFENPLNENQLSQTVIDQLGENANIYLASGDYTIVGNNAPNARLALLFGQSIFGRSENFRCPAIGDQRPVVRGGLDLFEGDNIIDSINLINFSTTSGLNDLQITGVNIANVNNIFFSNSIIDTTSSITGNNNCANFVTAIAVDNSVVLIENSVVKAFAYVGNNNFAYNSTVAIGNNIGDSGNNFILINDSQITSEAFVAEDNFFNDVPDPEYFTALNGATVIGNRALDSDILHFTNNQYVIKNSTLISKAIINGSSLTTTIWPTNFAAGIGNTIFGSQSNFTNNNFVLQNVKVESNADIRELNEGGNNLSAGIGNVVVFNYVTNADTLATFDNNKFTLLNGSVIANAHAFDSAEKLLPGAFVSNYQLAISIGAITDGSISSFDHNIFDIAGENLKAATTIDQNNRFANFAAAIGSKLVIGDTFDSNTFEISNSTLEALARVGGDSSSQFNFFIPHDHAAVFHIGEENLFVVNYDHLSAHTFVGGENLGEVITYGFFGLPTTTFEVSNSPLNLTAFSSPVLPSIFEEFGGAVVIYH